jgi:hypothetical protein
MADSKNTFVKSKMNKDLDDRLVPPGEYRDATNIGISRSEDADVGAVENILGNLSISDFGLGGGFNTEDSNVEIIGYHMDIANDRIFAFLTNYTDNSSTQLDNFAGFAAQCYISVYNIKTQDSKIIVQGRFLNFSVTHPINNANMVESLLFWTDNRNQPRKINVDIAWKNPTYYITEDNVSVAKYYPHKVIDLIDTSGATSISTMQDVVSEYLPDVNPGGLVFVSETCSIGELGCASCTDDYNPGDGEIPFSITGLASTTSGSGTGLTVSIDLSPLNSLGVGMLIPDSLSIDNPGEGYINNDTITFTYTDERLDVAPGTKNCNQTHIVECTYQAPSTATTNPDYEAFWPGDPMFLKDKFLRFSYRFKFEDGEYSLMAPFTQVAFIPEQDGYFLENDENRGYQSTELTWFQNKVNNINILINTPNGMTFGPPSDPNLPDNSLYKDLKVIEIDILAKESESLAIKVLDTIDKDTFSQTFGSVYTYNYQSRKAYKTLPEKDTIRVYDKTPVRSLTQEIVGNRIVYANYIDKHTPPPHLDYNIMVNEKSTEEENIFLPSYNIKEYPNHTLKQNRTYQIGVILSDRYGRQSSVILSSVDDGTTIGSLLMQGSTLYHDYRTEGIINPSSPTDPNYSWPGDALNILFNNYITSGVLVQGASSSPIPGFNQIWRKDINTGEPGLYDADTNPLGWYSYKIVVKQQEQDYYNIFFPGILNGTYDPNIAAANPPPVRGQEATPTKPSGYITLAGDNINKVPRALTNVGPDQKIFRTSRPTKVENPLWYSAVDKLGDFITVNFDNWDSPEAKAYTLQRNIELGITEPTSTENASVELYPRVQNIRNFITGFENKQSFPNRVSDTVVSIATCTDIGLCGDMSTRVPDEFFNPISDPLMARVEFQNFKLGVSCDNPNTIDEFAPKRPIFAVYETKPDISRLKLFWETSTTGIISELNQSIYDGVKYLPAEFTAISWSRRNEGDPGSESTSVSLTDAAWTSSFGVVNSLGTTLTTAQMVLYGVTDGDGDPIVGQFGLEPGTNPGEYYLYQKEHVWYGVSEEDRTFTFRIFVSDQGVGTVLELRHSFENVIPPAGYYIMNTVTPGGDNIENPGDAYDSDPCFDSSEWTLGGNTPADPFYQFADTITYFAPLLASNGTYIDNEYSSATGAVNELQWNDDNFPRAHNELEIRVISQTRYSGSGTNNSDGDKVAFFEIDSNFKNPPNNRAYPYAWLTANWGNGVEDDVNSKDLISGEIFEMKVEWRDCNGFTLNPESATFPLDSSTTFGASSGLKPEYGFSQATFYCQPEANFHVETTSTTQGLQGLMWLDEVACGSEAAKSLEYNWANNKTMIVPFGNESCVGCLDVGSDVSDLNSTGDDASGVFVANSSGDYNLKSLVDLATGWKPNGMAYDHATWSYSTVGTSKSLDLCSGKWNNTDYSGQLMSVATIPPTLIRFPDIQKSDFHDWNISSTGLVYGRVVMYKSGIDFDTASINNKYTTNDVNYFDQFLGTASNQIQELQSYSFLHNYNSGSSGGFGSGWDKQTNDWGGGCNMANISNGPHSSSLEGPNGLSGDHNMTAMKWTYGRSSEWWNAPENYGDIFTYPTPSDSIKGTPSTRRLIGMPNHPDWFNGTTNQRPDKSKFIFDQNVNLQAGEKVFIAVYSTYNPGLGEFNTGPTPLSYPLDGITAYFKNPAYNVGPFWKNYKYPNQLSMWGLQQAAGMMDWNVGTYKAYCGQLLNPLYSNDICICVSCGGVPCFKRSSIGVCIPGLLSCTCQGSLIIPTPHIGISFPALYNHGLSGDTRVQGIGGSVYMATNMGTYFEGELTSF